MVPWHELSKTDCGIHSSNFSHRRSCYPARVRYSTTPESFSPTVYPGTTRETVPLLGVGLYRTPHAQWLRFHVLCAIECVTGLLLTATTTSPSSTFTKSMVVIIRSSFGALRKIISDNGGAFIEAEFAASCQSLGIQRHLAAPEYPQRNVRVERADGQLKQHLYPLLTSNPRHGFAALLDQATNIYNKSPQLHSYSLSFLAFGCEQWYPESENTCQARERLLNQCHSELNDDTRTNDNEERAAVMLASDLPAKRAAATTEKST